MSTTAPTKTTPARWMDAAQTIGAALSSDGHTLYRIERNGDSLKCECDGWHYRGKCRHVSELAAQITTKPRFFCAICGQVPAPEGKCVCRRCAELALEEWRTRHAAAVAALPAIQESSDADVAEARVLHAETLAELPDILAAERNARARQAHTFVPGSTELVSTFEW